VVHWVGETASPEALKLIGWSKLPWCPGCSHRLHLCPKRAPAGRLNRVVLADGTTLPILSLARRREQTGYGPILVRNAGKDPK